MVIMTYIIGPGTELKRLLGSLGMRSTSGCPCDQRALLMDEQGPGWCRENLEVIVEWMREEANNRGLPFVSMLAKLLILRAIRDAERKLRIMNHG